MTKRAAISIIAGLEERIAEFAANCIQVCDHLPRGRAGSSNFKDQLARSATSAAANYAEATIPSSQRDFIGRLTIALKELAESRMHLSIILRLDYRRFITKSTISALVDEADAIAAVFRSALGGGKRKAAKSAKRAPPITRLLEEADVEPRKPPGRKKKTTPPKKKPSVRKKQAPKKATRTKRTKRAASTKRKTRTTPVKRTAPVKRTGRKPRLAPPSPPVPMPPQTPLIEFPSVPALPHRSHVLLPVFTPPPALPPPSQPCLLT